MAQASMFSSQVPPPVNAGSYGVLYIDDPWPEHGGGKTKRGADRHYDLMKVKDILAMPFGEWAADDAHCYLWATNNYLPKAFEAMKVRGFRYVTMITWVKERMGIGQYYRGRTEHCLFGVRGKLPYRVRQDGKRAQGETVLFEPDYSLYVDDWPEPDFPSAFEAARPHVNGKVKHSKKPAQMRTWIEQVSHGPYLELYAREASPGWDVWGNQAPTEAVG